MRAQIPGGHVERPQPRYFVPSEQIIREYLQTKMRIEVQTRDLAFGYKLIPAKARLINPKDEVEVSCFVAGGFLHKLVRAEKEINILDHLPTLVPKYGSKIGLVTYQNGIQNTLEDCQKMGESILKNLKTDQPLLIGLYNPTYGRIADDASRIPDPWLWNSYSILFTRQLFMTLAELIPTINQYMRWIHIAHSEGGLLANRVLNSNKYPLDLQLQQMFKRQLTTLTYGAVEPMPDALVKSAANTYTNTDIVVRHRGKEFLDKIPEPPDTDSEDDHLMTQIYRNKGKSYQAQIDAYKNIYYITSYPHECTKNGCTITVVNSEVPNPQIVAGDHSFLDNTYQKALKNDIDRLYGKMANEFF